MNAPDRSLAKSKTPRVDHILIAEMVEAGARVLDVGCGDGELLQLLTERRGVDGRGVELQRDKVNQCVARGLSVIQGDADRDLDNYPDQAFDYAILSLTIQATRQPKTVLKIFAHRAARDRVVSELRHGACALFDRRADAGDGHPAGPLVSDAKRASVHDPRFRRPLRTGRRDGRAGRRFQRL